MSKGRIKTREDVVKKVAGIAKIAYDDERAHSAEDGLREDVLKAIAEGAENPAELAAEALKTSEIAFARWCA